MMSYVNNRPGGWHHEIGIGRLAMIEPTYAQLLEILLRLEEDLLQFGAQTV